MCGEMFGGCQHVLFVNSGGLIRQAGALQTAHRRHPDAAAQVRIFAICLLGAAPARLTRQVQHRRQGIILAAHPHLACRCSKHFLHQLRVPGAGQPDRLREGSAAVSHQAMQGLVDEEGRDAQAGVLAQVMLDGIGCHGSLPGADVLSRPAQSSDAVGQLQPGGLVQFNAFLRQHVGLHMEDGHLGDLLFQRHACEQVGYPLWIGMDGFR